MSYSSIYNRHAQVSQRRLPYSQKFAARVHLERLGFSPGVLVLKAVWMPAGANLSGDLGGGRGRGRVGKGAGQAPRQQRPALSGSTSGSSTNPAAGVPQTQSVINPACLLWWYSDAPSSYISPKRVSCIILPRKAVCRQMVRVNYLTHSRRCTCTPERAPLLLRLHRSSVPP